MLNCQKSAHFGAHLIESAQLSCSTAKKVLILLPHLICAQIWDEHLTPFCSQVLNSK